MAELTYLELIKIRDKVNKRIEEKKTQWSERWDGKVIYIPKKSRKLIGYNVVDRVNLKFIVKIRYSVIYLTFITKSGKEIEIRISNKDYIISSDSIKNNHSSYSYCPNLVRDKELIYDRYNWDETCIKNIISKLKEIQDDFLNT